MKLLTLLSLVLPLLGTSIKPRPLNYGFSLVLGDCFESDTISLKINGAEIYNDIVAKSDFSLGITDIAVYQDKKGLWFSKGNSKIRRDKLTFSRTLNLEIKIGNITTRKTVDLKKGKVLLVENCYSASKTLRVVEVQQHKKTIILE